MKLKDEFLYLITHEFRTPMAVVNSALQAIELIYKEEVTSNVEKYIKIIKQNTNRQLRLVNNLLDIVKLDSGNLKLDFKPFDIIYLTKMIIESVEVYANQKGVNISLITNLDKQQTLIDEEKYERILLNLLANSVKFTPTGRSINVSISKQRFKKEDSLCISVIDEGIGIPNDKQEVIFDRFGQADTSLSRKAEGTGLGLHLVKLLVNALNGEITVESEVGQGTTFKIILPIVNNEPLDEIALTSENSNSLVQTDDRLIKSAAIEFSDIYF